RQTVFAGLDQPGTWPPTPRALRPQRLDLGLDSLPGVAVATQRKLGKLGLATVRDVLEHGPRRYETAADEVAVAELRQGEAEVIAAATVRRVVDAALPFAVHVPDPLPAELREREGLALKRDALAAVHRPRDLTEAETARQRLAFEELLVLQVGIARRAAERE